MNDKKIEEVEKPEELRFAEHLLVENKYTEALQVLTELEKKKELPLNHKVSCLLLQARILIWIGKLESSFKISTQAYKESLSLGMNLQTVPALNLMAMTYYLQGRFDKASEIITKSERLFQTFTKDSSAEYISIEAGINFIKGYLVSQDDADRGLEYLEYSLSLWDKIEPQLEKAITIMYIGWTLFYAKGELDQSINYLEQSLAIAEEINNKFGIALIYNNLGLSYQFKGELRTSLKHFEKSLKIFKEIKNKHKVAVLYSIIGEVLSEKGDVELALLNLEKSLAISKEVGSPFSMFSPLTAAIHIYLENGDIFNAYKYFYDFKKLFEQFKNPKTELWLVYFEAILLNNTQRPRDKTKAEELLKKILEKSDPYFQLTILTLIQLCDLYLTELHKTNNLEVLDEIDLLINRLLAISRNSHSYWILCETYILQARVALITLDLKKARRLLSQGQQVAERYGLNLSARKISNEHDELLKQLAIWKNFKKLEVTLTERLKLTRLNEQMDGMLRKRAIEPEDIQDEESVVILIISEGGNPVFSQSFVEGWSFQDHLFGGFLSAVNSFSDEMFSQGLDRAIFGEYTIIMNAISPFIVCYLFKGQSFLAQQRLKHFISTIQKNKEIWETVKKYSKANRLIQETDIPSLDILVNEVFIKRTT